MTAELSIRRLETGFWLIRGRGPCNWAQVRRWPCTRFELEEGTFHEAGDRFRAQVERARVQEGEATEVQP